MKFFLTHILWFVSLIDCLALEKEQYVKLLFELQFKSAGELGKILDEEESLPHFSFITQLMHNSGQEPIEDKNILESIENSNEALDPFLTKLTTGTYYLYNQPSNEISFGLLTEALHMARDEEMKKLCYFLILELYSQEIVQSSEDYLDYIREYELVASSPSEIAWFHIHYLTFITKSIDPEIASIYPKAFESMTEHFENNVLPNALMARYYFEGAIFYRFDKDYENAKKLILRVVHLSAEYPYLNNLKFSSLILLCHIESLNGNYDEAKKTLDLAKEYWNKSDSVRSEFVQNKFSSDYYYSQIDQYDSAYFFLLQSTHNERQLDFRRNTLKISELNVKLKTAEKENEILAQQNQIASQNKWLITVAVLTLILVLLLVAIGVSFKKIRSKNKKIETLMRELHHRVKNNLQVISSLLGLQSMKLKDPIARKAVSEGKDRLRAMSLIHQKLYQKEEVISLDVREYITNLVSELRQSYGFNDMGTVSIDIPVMDLDADTSLPIGLIVNEIVSNAFKYAFAGVKDPKLELQLNKIDKKNASLIIKDNGIGMPQNFSVENASSFGMRLIGLLVKQLKGTMQVTNKDGVSYSIKFQLT